MHFIEIKNKFEEESYNNNAFITLGTNYSHNKNCQIINDGWYVKLLLPFKKIKKYTDPCTFKEIEDFCRFSVLFRRRKNITRYYTGWIQYK